MPIDPAVIAALKVVLVDEALGDFIYTVRDRALDDDDNSFAGSSWDHPRVIAFGHAVDVLERFYKEMTAERAV